MADSIDALAKPVRFAFVMRSASRGFAFGSGPKTVDRQSRGGDDSDMDIRLDAVAISCA